MQSWFYLDELHVWTQISVTWIYSLWLLKYKLWVSFRTKRSGTTSRAMHWAGSRSVDDCCKSGRKQATQGDDEEWHLHGDNKISCSWRDEEIREFSGGAGWWNNQWMARDSSTSVNSSFLLHPHPRPFHYLQSFSAVCCTCKQTDVEKLLIWFCADPLESTCERG